MKLHERDWYGLVFTDRRRRRSYLENPGGFMRRIAGSRSFIWKNEVFNYGGAQVFRFEFVSSRRYFIFTGSDSDLEKLLAEDDAPRLVSARGRSTFGYPCYVGIFPRPNQQPEFTFLTPFAGLAREIWLSEILAEYRGEVLFRKCNIASLHKRMKEKGQPDELLQLRSGRAVIEPEDDPNVKSLILNGPDVMGSKIYRLLFEEGIPNFRVHLDDLYSKVAFYGKHIPAVVTYMDRNGNYRFRPGFNGKRLISFCSFINHLVDADLLEDELHVSASERLAR